MTIPTRGTPPIDDELLSAYLDGQVSPAERDAVEAAIAADPAVRARAADLRATVALLRSLPQPAPRRTFILTPEQGAAIRPVRVPWITRLFPAVAAVSAVAAVLCLALLAGDLTTGGFSTKKQITTARPAIESASDATTTRAASAAIAPTSAPAATTAAAVATAALPASGPLAAAATTAPPAPAGAAALAPGTTAAASSARSQGAPAISAAAIAPTATGGAIVAAPPFTPTTGPFAASNTVSPVRTTTVANVQTPPSPANPASPVGATATKETHRIPVALVRAGEILLALLAIAGIALAAFGWRGRARRT